MEEATRDDCLATSRSTPSNWNYRNWATFLVVLSCWVLPQHAIANEQLTVVASIKPIHSIVSAIMEGVGEPHLVMKGAASPHTFILRPSDARALHNADVVFQVGETMEQSLADIIWTIAEKAEIVSLATSKDLVTYSHRVGGVFGTHADHGHGVDSHGHGKDEHHDETSHEDEEPILHDEIDREMDMHIWLDPANGKVIARTIEKVLSEWDPDNASTYASNLNSYLEQLNQLENDIQNQLADISDTSFLVFHDAYQYFERRFGLNVAGSVQEVAGSSLSAKRIRDLQAMIVDQNVKCVFTEPQFDADVVNTIMGVVELHVDELDPLGADLEDGPALYPALLRQMTNSFAQCLTPT